MPYTSWRGVVGVVKSTMRPGSLEEFIRLLPEGIGVIPLLFPGIQGGREDEIGRVADFYEAKVAELAQLNVDLIHTEVAPPFMIHGYKGEGEIIKRWENKYRVPIVTAGMTQVEALRALKVKKIVGVTYLTGKINDTLSRYFIEAGFDVAAMDGMNVAFDDVPSLSSQAVYAHIRKVFLRHPEANAIYMLGSGWRTLDIISLLEQDLQVPVVHPVPARVWAIQKRLHVRQPKKAYGRLLEEMP